jgi:hypothetical protein
MAKSNNTNNEFDVNQSLRPTVFKRVDPSDVMFNPFQSYKLWSRTSGSAWAVGTDDSKYHSVNHMFYKYATEPAKTFGPNDLVKTSKSLFLSASIFSIPERQLGEGIKPASVTITSGSITLQSDKYSNIYDTSISTSSLLPYSYYQGFNQQVVPVNVAPLNANQITYVTGYSGSGYAAKFNGNGYVTEQLIGQYDRFNNYTVSFFISASNTSTDSKLIVGKCDAQSTQYPFKIELSGSNQVVFSAAGSTTYIAQITSSILDSGSWQHVACQKSGSWMKMWIDGVAQTSMSSALLSSNNGVFTSSARIDNTSSMYMGGFSTNTSNLTGVLDELRVFNYSVPETSLNHLYNSSTFLQTRNVGNVFPKQGVFVISSANPKYNQIATSYTASWRSTVTVNELSVITRLDQGDFNMSLNPTLTADNDITYQSFVTGSDFSPYITTIGLYNDAGQLLMVGKLAQPIKKRRDVDMNFLLRIDLDKKITKA